MMNDMGQTKIYYACWSVNTLCILRASLFQVDPMRIGAHLVEEDATARDGEGNRPLDTNQSETVISMSNINYIKCFSLSIDERGGRAGKIVTFGLEGRGLESCYRRSISPLGYGPFLRNDVLCYFINEMK